MRIIRITLKSVAPLVAIMGLMVLPSVSSAQLAPDASTYTWAGGDPLGSSTVDGPGGYEDHVTLAVSGDIGISKPGVSLGCDVDGEIDVWNDFTGEGSPEGLLWEIPWPWTDFVDGPHVAQNAIVSLTATNCQGSVGSCQLSGASFGSLPWSGAARSHITQNTQIYNADFAGVSITWTLTGAGCSTVVSTGTLASEDEWDPNYGAVRSFTFDGSSLSTSGGIGTTTVDGGVTVTGATGPGVIAGMPFDDYGGVHIAGV